MAVERGGHQHVVAYRRDLVTYAEWLAERELIDVSEEDIARRVES